MRRPFLPAVLLAFAPAAVAAEPAARPVPEITARYDVTYATVGGENLQLDFAAPKSGGPFPCVVCLHGGAWKFGSRKDLSRPVSWAEFGEPGKSLVQILAEHGYAAASVGYRLAPKYKFPAQIEDAKTAVRYLRAHAKELNIDPDHIGAIGFSAGGHLAALLGTTDKSAGFDGPLYPEQSSRVQCVVDFFGPADLTLYTETPGVADAYFVPLLGKSAREGIAAYKRASPIDYVTKDDPPFLIVQGTADLLVPAIHSERLHAKLTAAGVKSELLLVKGKGHGWGGEDAARATAAAEKFFAEHLKGK